MVVAVIVLGFLGLAAIAFGAWALLLRPGAPRRVTPTRQTGPGQASADVEGLVRAGRKGDAVKAFREGTGTASSEAPMPRSARGDKSPRTAVPGVVPLRVVSDDDIKFHVRSGNLIDAIKLYREKNGVGVREAKDAVEAMRDRMRAS